MYCMKVPGWERRRGSRRGCPGCRGQQSGPAPWRSWSDWCSGRSAGTPIKASKPTLNMFKGSGADRPVYKILQNISSWFINLIFFFMNSELTLWRRWVSKLTFHLWGCCTASTYRYALDSSKFNLAAKLCISAYWFKKQNWFIFPTTRAVDPRSFYADPDPDPPIQVQLNQIWRKKIMKSFLKL